MWKSIREGPEKFFGHIVYNVGEGHRISFCHDPCCVITPLKERFPDLFTRSLSKEAWISDLIISASEGGSRCWNIQFCQAPEDWEQENVCSFFDFMYSSMPRGEGDDTSTWKLTKTGCLICALTIICLVLSLRFFLGSEFGVQRCLNGCLSFYGQ